MSYDVQTWQEALMVAGSTTLARLLSFIPNLLGAIIVFLIGWLVSGWLRSLVIKMLSAARLQSIVQKTVVEQFIQKAELKGKIEEIIGGLVRWVVVFIFFIAAINILGLSTVSLVLNNILAYIPKVLSAIIILLVGVVLAGAVESIVKGTVGAVDVSTSRLLGKISSWMVMIFAVLASISELGIAAQFINTLVIGVVAALSLGFGLALGLGSKDVVGEILSGWYKELQKDLKRK